MTQPPQDGWAAARTASTGYRSSWPDHRVTVRSGCFENPFEPGQILSVGSSHRTGHQWCHQRREASRFTPIAKLHPGAARCSVAPQVRRLHGERTFSRALDEPLAEDEFVHLVRVAKRPTEESSDEGDLRANGHRFRRLPLNGLDVSVPARGVVRVGGVRSDNSSGSVDLNLRCDIDGYHRLLPEPALVPNTPTHQDTPACRRPSGPPTVPRRTAEDLGILGSLRDRGVARAGRCPRPQPAQVDTVRLRPLGARPREPAGPSLTRGP